MKKSLIFILLIAGISLKAQQPPCVQVTCPDTVKYNITTDTLRSNFVGYTPTTILWFQIAGLHCTIVNPNSQNTPINGLSSGQLYVFGQSTSAGNFSTVAYTSVFVLPAPLPPPPVSVSKVITTVTNSDGTTKTTQNYP